MLSTANKETFSNGVWELLLQWCSQDWKQELEQQLLERVKTAFPVFCEVSGKGSCMKAQLSSVIKIEDEMWGHCIWFKNILLLLFSPT